MKDQCYRENFYFERFREIYHPLSGRIFNKDEKPDFITCDNLSPIIAVELTEIVTTRNYRKNSIIQSFSIEKQIAEEAGEIFTEKYKVPLNVSIDFYDNMTISKSSIRSIASHIADIVSLYIPQNSPECYHFTIEENLFDSIRDIRGSYFERVTQPVWYNAYSAFVPPLEPIEIENVLKKKENKIKFYRDRADLVYLLIIEGIMPSWHDSITEALDHEYKSSFDMVILYRVHDNSYHPVKVIHP